MAILTKPVLACLFALSLVNADYSTSQYDNPNGKHILSDSTAHPLKPALHENITHLPPSYTYPNIFANPLLGNLKPGPIINGIKTRPAKKDPLSELGKFNPRLNAHEDAKSSWLNHQVVTLHSNATQQKFEFNFDIWEKLSTRGKFPAELSHAGISQPTKLSRRESNPDRPSDWDCSGNTKRSVLGTDDRNEICNTWGFPYRVTGLVNPIGCSGVLISPHHVLTVGHCVFNRDSKTWYDTKTYQLPLRSGPCASPTYDFVNFNVSQVWSTVGWVQNGDATYDWAVLVLDTPSTNYGWMSFGWDSTLSKDSGVFNMNGYPGDKAANTLWHAPGRILTVYEKLLQFDYDAVPGDSGAPVYGYYPSQGDLRIVYGPQSWANWDDGDEWHANSGNNQAVRITQERFRIICELMHQTLPQDQWVC